MILGHAAGVAATMATPSAGAGVSVGGVGVAALRLRLKEQGQILIPPALPPPPPPPPWPSTGVWFAWKQMFKLVNQTIAATEAKSLLKRVTTVPSGKLPPSEVCRVPMGTVLRLTRPAETTSDGYFRVALAAGQRCPQVAQPPQRQPQPLQEPARPLVGINYFAGWWQGAGDKWMEPWNASVDWRPLYPERVPLLGSYNSQATMDAEITAAADHGVDFFQMLWYDNHPERAANARLLNRGVEEFMKSPNSSRMKFFIEWCNSYPLFAVKSDADWEAMVHDDWLPALRHPSYLRVGGALVFKVINAGTFLKYGCGMNHSLVEARWAMLRNVVRQAGLGEMIIGAGAAPNDMTKAAWWGGGVSYNFTGLYCAVDHDDPEYMGQVLPWKNESDYVRENRVAHAQAHGIPFVPMVVSGWDPRERSQALVERVLCVDLRGLSGVCAWQGRGASSGPAFSSPRTPSGRPS